MNAAKMRSDATNATSLDILRVIAQKRWTQVSVYICFRKKTFKFVKGLNFDF